jgi:hypothetical protein
MFLVGARTEVEAAQVNWQNILHCFVRFFMGARAEVVVARA